MASEEYASLLAKLQSNGKSANSTFDKVLLTTPADVDAKIDAVGKLQLLLDTKEFEVGAHRVNT
jgi:hypothetical protein